MTKTSLNHAAITSIVGGFNRDPFGVLGRHTDQAETVYRTFQPFAEKMVLHIGENQFLADKIHPDGLFEVKLDGPTPPLHYQWEQTSQNGTVSRVDDPYRFQSAFEGTDSRLYEYCGARVIEHEGVQGVQFAVWAPNAERVSVVGDFNRWDGRCHVMRFHPGIGIWEMFIPGLAQGVLYKYEIKTSYMGYVVKKSDPVGFYSELRPNTASIVWDIDNYSWQDEEWIASRPATQALTEPVSVYEVHLGSWRRKGTHGEEWLTYRELADELIPYAKEMNYTHIELLPISEHPLDASWGYQVTGYFAPTSRFGTPQDFMYFVDRCHQNGIGVILDWVPAHFPKDEHGLSFFDGTFLYEHADPRQGEHPDWGTKIFNYGRAEVRDFLISNVLFWIDKYHIDGIRVDAVASMLYLDFSREHGEWVPNRYGGRENIDALTLLRDLNRTIHDVYPGTLTIAEESTAWSGVTRPVDDHGGLGFDLKWNMGWMHDTIQYMKTDPLYRSYHQGMLTFSLLYAFSEKYVLSFSHDEVVHMKGSMIGKMPGDDWQKFANLRALFGYMYAHPGRKLNFMGNEIGQWSEWSENRSLDWHLLEHGTQHIGVQTLIKDLNATYISEKSLHFGDNSFESFQWIDFRDARHSVIIFKRSDPSGESAPIIVVCNFTPEARIGYRIGVPEPGIYREFLNTDHERYGGGGIKNRQDIQTKETPWQEQPASITATLPPLSTVFFKKV